MNKRDDIIYSAIFVVGTSVEITDLTYQFYSHYQYLTLNRVFSRYMKIWISANTRLTIFSKVETGYFVTLLQLHLNKLQHQPLWLRKFVSQTFGYNGAGLVLVPLILYWVWLLKHFLRQNLLREEFVTCKVLTFLVQKEENVTPSLKGFSCFKRLLRLKNTAVNN